ncbi:MAG: glycosyltransferase family 2 protein [Candidatus Fermentibacteraceae bacterium]
MTSTVIVLNYNGAHFLPDCLGSLEGNTPADCSVMVVDNGSTDGSLSLLETGYPWVRVLALGKNLGFTGGNNAGVKASDSEIVVLLNNDTRVAPEWLSNLLKPFSDPGVGAVTSSMRRFGEIGVMDSAGGCIDALAYSRDRGRGEPAENWNNPDEILFPCGGAMAVRRSALEEPERVFWNELFIYSEDMDLGISLWRRGFRVVYQPEAVVEHHFSGTMVKVAPKKERLCNRNRILVLRKHLSRRAMRGVFAFLCVWQLIWLLSLLLRGRFLTFRAVLSGTLAGLRESIPASVTFPVSGDAILLRFMEKPSGGGLRGLYARMCRRSLARTSGSFPGSTLILNEGSDDGQKQ